MGNSSFFGLDGVSADQQATIDELVSEAQIAVTNAQALTAQANSLVIRAGDAVTDATSKAGAAAASAVTAQTAQTAAQVSARQASASAADAATSLVNVQTVEQQVTALVAQAKANADASAASAGSITGSVNTAQKAVGDAAASASTALQAAEDAHTALANAAQSAQDAQVAKAAAQTAQTAAEAAAKNAQTVAGITPHLTTSAYAVGMTPVGDTQVTLPTAGTLLTSVKNLQDIGNPATARTNLGLGTLATQNADAVNITGGTIKGATISGGGGSGVSLDAPILTNPTVGGVLAVGAPGATSTAVIGFHTSGNVNDVDARIYASGGKTTSGGAGTMTFQAGTLNIGVAGNTVSVAGVSTWGPNGGLTHSGDLAVGNNAVVGGTFSTLAGRFQTVMSGANPGIEMGNTSTAVTPFFDFHSSGTTSDYDARLIASGGNSAAGQGTLAVIAANLALGNAGGTVSVAGGRTTWDTNGTLTHSGGLGVVGNISTTGTASVTDQAYIHSASEAQLDLASTGTNGRRWRIGTGSTQGAFTNGLLGIYDTVANAARTTWAPDGTLTHNGNISIRGGLSVSLGVIDASSVSIAGLLTASGGLVVGDIQSNASAALKLHNNIGGVAIGSGSDPSVSITGAAVSLSNGVGSAQMLMGTDGIQFIGPVSAQTVAAGITGNTVATTQYVADTFSLYASNDAPKRSGVASAGTSALYARADHVHPAGEGGSGGGLSPTNNLADLTDYAQARTNLGLGTMATQNADGVNIQGGTFAYGTVDQANFQNGYITASQISDGFGGQLVAVDPVKGYGTPINGNRIANFNASGATLAQTAALLAQLIVDLQYHGLIRA